MVVRAAKRSGRMSWLFNGLPVGYVEADVFVKDFRRRRLRGFGLGSAYLCRIKRKRLGHVEHIGLLGGISERWGRVIIDWNRAGLEEVRARESI